MSAVAWTHWDEAFTAADKEPEKRLTFTLTPPLFERALVSLASEHGWLERKDPRYQEACRLGVLEWWDGRGRCVVVLREGSVMKRVYAEDTAARVEASRTRPEFPPGTLLTPAEATPQPGETPFQQFDRIAAPIIKAAEEKAIATQQAQIEAPKGKGKKK